MERAGKASEEAVRASETVTVAPAGYGTSWEGLSLEVELQVWEMNFFGNSSVVESAHDVKGKAVKNSFSIPSKARSFEREKN